MNVAQLVIYAAIALVALTLAACGGGGGNPGTCQGSAQVCFGTGDAASTAGGTSGAVVELFSRSGTGDTVFTLPANVTRVQIQASYGGVSHNFIVKVGGALVVNEIVGTSQNPATFAGTLLVAGGSVVEISGSTGVTWQVTQVRPDTAIAPGLFSLTGTGPAVFDLPVTATRVRIHAAYGGTSKNFVVKVAGVLLVNEILGSSQNLTSFDGTYAIAGGGTMQIVDANGVTWSVQQIQ